MGLRKAARPVRDFNPRAPCGARLDDRGPYRHPRHFNPRAPCGARPPGHDLFANQRYFNPRAPCGARRSRRRTTRTGQSISTHAPLAGRDLASALCRYLPDISTHAPLAGRDPHDGARNSHSRHISTHAPLAGRDECISSPAPRVINFNPRAPCGARRSPCGPPKTSETDFNPRAPCGARQSSITMETTKSGFQPTRPLRGATGDYPAGILHHAISTHAPLAGRDVLRRRGAPGGRHFNPRAPCGARPSGPAVVACAGNFNPRAPCGARRGCRRCLGLRSPISTHAPLAGRDNPTTLTRWTAPSNFNPRAPCGARLDKIDYPLSFSTFQPTRPLRGATGVEVGDDVRDDISTHAPLAGRDHRHPPLRGLDEISTHAPLAGRDDFFCLLEPLADAFQPTRPLRGATNSEQMPFLRRDISTHAPLAGRDHRGRCRCGGPAPISTHAPLAGRDRSTTTGKRSAGYFNPRAPCGARRTPKCSRVALRIFQPTRPLRGATRTTSQRAQRPLISTHAPLAGRDR